MCAKCKKNNKKKTCVEGNVMLKEKKRVCSVVVHL